MRTISYKTLGGMGAERPQAGTVADLLLEIPYLLITRIIPPLHVVHNLLVKGIFDAGISGGCEWEPFQLSPTQWEEVAHATKQAHEVRWYLTSRES